MYRINKLLKQNIKLFHTNDLALLWDISNRNTLYTTISRYLKKGILIQIHKGFYSTVPLDKIDPVKLALGYLHRYAYVSCETVLIKYGIIFQKENYITLVSDTNRKFSAGGHSFLVRSMKDEFLYNSFGIQNKNSVLTASLERAVADMLYFNPRYYFDNNKIINFKKVREIQREVGYI